MKNKIESIQVFGSGCASCHKLFELTKEAVQEMNLDAEVEYVTDFKKIVLMGIMSLPAMAINGKVVLAGQLPDTKKIKELLS